MLVADGEKVSSSGAQHKISRATRSHGYVDYYEAIILFNLFGILQRVIPSRQSTSLRLLLFQVRSEMNIAISRHKQTRYYARSNCFQLCG